MSLWDDLEAESRKPGPTMTITKAQYAALAASAESGDEGPNWSPSRVPTVVELDGILRRSLPFTVVYAIAPTGDPFTRWARYMLEGCKHEPEADR